MPPSGPLRVLVVEDERLLRNVVSTALQDEGFIVIEAASAETALVSFNVDAPDVLFIDIGLPGSMDGQKLAEHCRALRPSMPVIYTTGRGTPPTLVSGAVFLPKPYRVAHLIDVIRDLTGFDDRSTI